MQIVCPHCATSYAVDPTSFGTTGRTVRCARCRETWLAYPEQTPAYSSIVDENDPGWGIPADDDLGDDPAHDSIPEVESPSITSDLPDDLPHDAGPAAHDAEWTALAREDDETMEDTRRSWLARLRLPALSLGPLARPGAIPFGLPIACGVMGMLVLGLIVWRADVVRVMPQTAAFFRMVGLSVNLRGLAFEDVRISTELVENKPVLIIEGNIVDVAKKPIEIPRLRFLVRDANGTEIYAWNAVLDQPALKPGEKAWFKSRLASPPQDGREIVVRFFNRRDIAAGGA
ncbi:zinc-ribbon domain-containing protein [Bradyrhizobium sp. U87765 SZCCT0131]|uniref:MJ0042-type zinc finger domain-containing protein n=1 Tax=unclassified Bradyrhizobium TaxID=2631580 RepID=UPI001BAE2D46|nr:MULTISPECIES: MJ0042-type zinc finger domain-containing protein [unclassified Bradyrhizobium]MBR1220719.1 zinc-ribbon domain-containing protein [Bradyrhizobium sp. U87765 SZCCT0131]MBR1260461.1 zinc-ribbon domain-containing protein [Bradyrhizobium sp. U87765 SZCCT0134]MBR1307290.1 zinc-ribbon domain-containing protein [Bradyrhizobium sp. U87765 SZCCT0110]MBR1321244.1 zinc-ribbon domain-containing protein [Bradyrhizobium sp. U87765 SZCCT0109]MBR1349557.1 zinc-ribbon domain-containing protein